MISGNMADILSDLYLGYSLIAYHQQFKGDPILRDECIKELMQDAEYKMNLIIFNYPIKSLKPFLQPLKSKLCYTKLEDKNRLYNYILTSDHLNDLFNNEIYYDGTVLEKLIKLSKLDKSSKDYNLLYEDIIKVGEYKL
jgi:hypothetical protein